MVTAYPNTNVITILCNKDTYDPNDGYSAGVQNVLANVIAKMPTSGYNHYTSQLAPDNKIVYGHGDWSRGLSSTYCMGCLSYAFAKLMNGCPYRRGAQLQLQDCRLRYEDYPFIE